MLPRPALFVLAATLLLSPTAEAGDTLCDPAYENCRTPLIDLIRNERLGIDVGFWFMEDARYTTELRLKMEEGVPVRVLVDPRANSTYPYNADRLAELQAAGIPMRRKVGSGILHWKMMLFHGQNTVQFSAANYSSSFINYAPYENYIDEAIYFTDDPSIVNSFRTKFDDLWTNTSRYSDYANVTRPLQRHYGNYPKDPELNFPPQESFRNRALARYRDETEAIDVTMYRITDRRHTDAMISAMARGVPVRLITEPKQYRDRSRYWHSWNVDRLYVAGAQIRHRAHQGLMHQKSVQLHSQRMVIFGSSNWTSPSSTIQEEHNYFTTKPYFWSWFTDQFERKWNNLAGYLETEPFQPLPPDDPVLISPADMSTQPDSSTVTLRWNAGIWAHFYDIYFGTSPDPPLIAANEELGPSTSSTNHRSFTVSGLVSGTTYYWRIVAKTMAYQTSESPLFSFTTQGTRQAGASGDDIVLYAAGAPVVQGAWVVQSDATAAGGRGWRTRTPA